jgi:RNA polymerase sigma-70 factor, ECF subfamily
VLTWLLTIARHSAQRVGTQEQRRTSLARQPGGGVRALDASSTTEIALLLDALPAERREALVLTSVLGLSYAEAAEVCGCAVGTIRSRVARARSDLLRALAGEDQQATA